MRVALVGLAGCAVPALNTSFEAVWLLRLSPCLPQACSALCSAATSDAAPAPTHSASWVQRKSHAPTLTPRVVLDMAPRPDGLKEAELKTVREMATMVTKRLEADVAAAARARAKDELLCSLDFVRAPFALCTLAPGGRMKIRYANSSWAWEAGALHARERCTPRLSACLRVIRRFAAGCHARRGALLRRPGILFALKSAACVLPQSGWGLGRLAKTSSYCYPTTDAY